jgi:cold shock CspA family protein
MQGVVKRVEVERGFGFITSPDHPTDLFFHVSAVDRGITWDEQMTGLRVVFDIEDWHPRGPRAVRIGRAA